ncbi:MAG: YgeY family selenium metabolism-linked hydrolase [bacterium]
MTTPLQNSTAIKADGKLSMFDFHRVNQWAESQHDACAIFLADLIAIPSISRNEGRVIQRVADEMKAVGFDSVEIDDFGNCIGRIGNGGHVIAFDAHVDTVDVGAPELWGGRNSFEPRIENGILYGRGAADQKGGMAALVYAGKGIRELNLEGDWQFVVVGSVSEEDCDGLCWQYLVRERIVQPEVVVLTEPTELSIYRGQRGRMEIEVSTSGISCHGSAPECGDNAIYKMAPIVKDIERLNGSLDTDSFLGKGTVTISEIRSTSPSLCAVADSCIIHLDRRLTAGETKELALEQIRMLASVKQVQAEVRLLDYRLPTWRGMVYPTESYFPAWTTPEDSRAIRCACVAHEKLFGKPARLGCWAFSTNGVATAGLLGIPTIGFGPASEAHAHAPTDQIPLCHLPHAVAFYMAYPDAYISAIQR